MCDIFKVAWVMSQIPFSDFPSWISLSESVKTNLGTNVIFTADQDPRGWKYFSTQNVTEFSNSFVKEAETKSFETDRNWLADQLFHCHNFWKSINHLKSYYQCQYHTHHQCWYPLRNFYLSSSVVNATACGEPAPADSFMKVLKKSISFWKPIIWSY